MVPIYLNQLSTLSAGNIYIPYFYAYNIVTFILSINYFSTFFPLSFNSTVTLGSTLSMKNLGLMVHYSKILSYSKQKTPMITFVV